MLVQAICLITGSRSRSFFLVLSAAGASCATADKVKVERQIRDRDSGRVHRLLTAELYFFRLHSNRVFIGRNTTPSLVSVDLSKFSAKEHYLGRIINP